MFKNFFQRKPPHIAFWEWFVKHQDVFYQFPGDMNPWFDQLHRQLAKVHPELAFEFSLNLLSNGKREFIISAGGLKAVFPVVMQLIDCAPELEQFKFTPFIPRKGIMTVDYAGYQMSANLVVFTYESNPGRPIDLELFIKGFRRNEQESIAACFLLLDSLLGEYDVATKLGVIKFADWNEQPENVKKLQELPSLVDQHFLPFH